jgi:hypothetical protein
LSPSVAERKHVKPWIENVGRSDIPRGNHRDPGPSGVLISINDPDLDPPPAGANFAERYDFNFLDVEAYDIVQDESHRCTAEDGKQIAEILTAALAKGANVVVHCTAGVCRSGAVVEVGTILGFQEPNRYRSPNLHVKHQIMRALGMTYDSDEPPPNHSYKNSPVWE